MENGFFSFGSTLSVTGNSRLCCETFQALWKGFCYQAGSLSWEKTREMCFLAGTIDLPRVPQGREFLVEVTEAGAAVAAKDYPGLARGMMALMTRIEAVSLEPGRERFRIRSCRLESRYTVKTRMIHLCVFSETSRLFLEKTIRLAGVMQYTHLILEFWGMVRYDCEKTLAWENAYSKAEVRQLVQQIEDLGMEAIPMVNHLGHAAGCRASGGKHVVLDQNPRLACLFSPDGWSWNIDNPEARSLLRTMRQELYEVFPNCRYIHLGCDEVYSYESGEDDQARMRAYLRSILEEVKAEGKKPIIWGDMLLNPQACGVTKPYFCGCDTPENARKLIDAIPKDTIIADWHYDVRESPIRTSVYLKEQGFPVLGAPWFDTANCQAHVDTVREYGLMGLMVTTWHTLAERMPHIVTDALMCGAYHSPWSGDTPNKIRTETAALLRKVCFVDGSYPEAGWTDRQISLQAYPMT